jgi:type 1 glutamine amidotransferase
MAALAGILVSVAPAAMRAQEAPARKKVLMVWGGWEGHQPKQTVDVFAPWLTAQGFDVEIANTLDVYLDAQKLKGLSLIVQAVTMGAITPRRSGDCRRGPRWRSPAAVRRTPDRSARTGVRVGGRVGGAPGTSSIHGGHRGRPDPITKGLSGFRIRSEQHSR